MLDVVPLPERKKPNFRKATQKQLDILMAGFAVSDISSKPHLAALSEATGLPTKWIASWFTRQRKKVANASAGVDTQDDATTEVKGHKDQATAAMSVQEIVTFKTEYTEPASLGTLALPADSESEQKPVLSHSQKPIKKTKKPTKKRRSKPTPYPQPPPSPLKTPFVSAPLPTRSVPSSHEYNLLEAQPQPTDRASPTSTFILREMIPVPYKPKTPSAAAINPPLSEVSEVFSPSLSAGHPTLEIVSNEIRSLCPETSLYPPATSSSTEALYADAVYPWQDSCLTGDHQKLNIDDSKTTLQKPLNRSNILTSGQKKSVHSIDPSLRPLLPVNSPVCDKVMASHQYLHYYSQILGTQTRDDRNTKENRPLHPQRAPYTSSRLRSSGPRTLPPLYTTADLTVPRARQSVQNTTDGAVPTSVATCTQNAQQETPVAESTKLPLAAQNENEIRFDDQPGPFVDSTTAPLKYLDVLMQLPDTSLSMDENEMVSRLLDPQLAEDDPFQAAMGLVFASQLGLNWDYT
ncbi:hypothetical protein C0992_005057 [Termitomyces sp. T32_za158]|nr:hypothetical protein C0992_005057 [Termitomyces sp. T32_za158]